MLAHVVTCPCGRLEMWEIFEKYQVSLHKALEVDLGGHSAGRRGMTGRAVIMEDCRFGAD